MILATVNQRGGALLITLAIMVMLTIAAIFAVNTAQTDIDLSFNQLHSDQAFYVAEAGLAQAFMDINEDNYWNDGYVNVAFEGGLYSVAVVDYTVQASLDDTVILRASGQLRDANANIEAVLVPEYERPFDYAMFSDVSITMINNTCSDSYNSDSGSYATTVEDTEGDVATNGDLIFDNTVTIGGDASSAEEGGIDLCATCTVVGDTATGVDPYVMDPVADSLFTWAESVSPAPIGLSGTYYYNPANADLEIANNDTVYISGGTYYFRNITMGKNVSFQVVPGEQVVIYLDGDLEVGETSNINTDGDPIDLIIYGRGSDIVLGEGSIVVAAFYDPDATVALENNVQFYGSIVSKTTSVVNSACVHYDRALRAIVGSRTGNMIMLAWKEL